MTDIAYHPTRLRAVRDSFRALRAAEFPWTADTVYLNNASIGPIPERTRRTLDRSEEHTSELQSLAYLVCRLLLEKKKKIPNYRPHDIHVLVKRRVLHQLPYSLTLPLRVRNDELLPSTRPRFSYSLVARRTHVCAR